MVQEAKKLYKTKPLENWGWAKELRKKYYERVMKAKELGLVLSSGSAHSRILGAGLENHIHFGGEPYGASLAQFPELATECVEATETLGFARDMCAYMRLYWGSVALNKSPWGEFPKPEFVIQSQICDSHSKWHQHSSEMLGVPFYTTEVPQFYPAMRPPDKYQVDYVAAQFSDMVEWIEKTTGRKWNDQLFADALLRLNRLHVLWAKICELNQAIPAPLDIKSMFALYWPSTSGEINEETENFYKALLEEVQDRVKNQIAAVATERARVLHENQPPWYALWFFREMEKYGCVCIGGGYLFFLGGSWELYTDEKGKPSMRVEKPIEERLGRPKNREDCMHMLSVLHFGRYRMITSSDAKRAAAVAIARGWKVDGAILMQNRGCEGLSLGISETRVALINEGFPTMAYEANMADRREWDEAQVRDRLEAFMESLGLKRLEP